MRGKPFLQKSDKRQFIVFTDLDGTLLDHDTYAWEAAAPAMNRCKELDIPLVLVSSKTRAEMEPIRRDMSISDPFITENGGAIFFPSTTFSEPPPNACPVAGPERLWKLPLGMPYPQLIEALQELRRVSGLNLKGMSHMTGDEISRLTGLDPKAARLAAMREYDEPFIILEEQASDPDVIVPAAKKLGLNVALGGRFYHLLGGNDKGQAMGMVIALYKKTQGRVTSIALGDSPNDFPMLERADYPVLIRSRRSFPTLKKKIPGLRFTREMGPRGWNSAILDILNA